MKSEDKTDTIDLEQAVLTERARYIGISMPMAITFNFVGGSTTAALFWGAVRPLYLAIFTGIFAAQLIYWFIVCAKFRRTELTPEVIGRFFRLLRQSGYVTGITWGVGMFFFYPHGTLALQFAFLCAIVLLGMTVAFCFAPYYPAALSTFLPFSLAAVYIMAAQPAVFYSVLLSTAMFIPAQVFMALQFSRMLITSLRLRFENIELVAQLTVQREMAESALIAKSRFLAAASHDLRQPMHALGLFLFSMQRTALSPKQKELAGHIEASSVAAREMLDTLLDFSKLEAGTVVARPLSFPLQTMLRKLENEFAPQADAKNLLYRSRDTQCIAHADPGLVELILRNLISNALRYTERGGILIACRRRAGSISVEVWDTGIGIPSSQHHEIFREFYQVSNPERDRSKGLGLGLAIVDGLARTMGLQINLASIPARGSVFRLTLPPGIVVKNNLQAAPLAPLALNDIVADDTPLAERRVLVVEDDRAARLAMLELLGGWGCQCQAFESLEEAMHALPGLAPELVITDYRLREHRTGQDVLEALAVQLGRRLPAIIVTGDTAPERLREAQASGATLLHKPVAPAALRAAMECLLGDEEDRRTAPSLVS